LEVSTIIIIIIGVRGVGDNKGEQQLLIIDGEGEFDQDVFVFGNNFKMKNFLRHTMEAIVQWF
jgi:hypothetical protein